MRDFEIPGGTIINSAVGKGTHTLDINISSSMTDNPCTTEQWQALVKSVPSMSADYNARRKVRSSGMIRRKFDKNNRESYSVSAGQYMYQRNKTFGQNEFANIRSGDPETTPGTSQALANEYSSNTIQFCGDKFVPIYYKPNNSKFAQQGGVSGSTHLVRLKYDTITDAGAKMQAAYGVQTANALAYGVPENGYTIKDKIGYPNTCTPVFRSGIRKSVC